VELINKIGATVFKPRIDAVFLGRKGKKRIPCCILEMPQ
jgi:hypothetical protein